MGLALAIEDVDDSNDPRHPTLSHIPGTPSNETWDLVAHLPDPVNEFMVGEFVWLKESDDWYILVGPDEQTPPSWLNHVLPHGVWQTEWFECEDQVVVHYFTPGKKPPM